jgi:hypothetical protein
VTMLLLAWLPGAAAQASGAYECALQQHAAFLASDVSSSVLGAPLSTFVQEQMAACYAALCDWQGLAQLVRSQQQQQRAGRCCCCCCCAMAAALVPGRCGGRAGAAAVAADNTRGRCTAAAGAVSVRCISAGHAAGLRGAWCILSRRGNLQRHRVCRQCWDTAAAGGPPDTHVT